MFEWALKANIPIIGVTTDDLINFPQVLQSIAGGAAKYMGAKSPEAFRNTGQLFWTDDDEFVSRDLYTSFAAKDKQLIVVNPDPKNPFMFHSGIMPTPQSMVTAYLSPLTDEVAEIEQCVKGMSLKAIMEAVLITEARTGSLLPKDLRKTRSMLAGGTVGLTLLDTDLGFYQVPGELDKWMKVNSKFFTTMVHPKLTPRGLLFAGSAGVGKSMAAKHIAKQWGVPLYHLDIASLLTKYVGASEERLRNILSLLDREEPCVVLIDEVEKVINSSEDAGVTARILSQLLWWMQEHTFRVFTVMTTNDYENIPKELYRPGRVDKVMVVPKLKGIGEIGKFIDNVWSSVVSDSPCAAHVFSDAYGNPITEASHAEITGRVYDLIKSMPGVLTNKETGVES